MSGTSLGSAANMPSRSEEATGRYVCAVLAGLAVGESIEASENLTELLDALEFFLPSILADAFPSPWRHESFDAFRLASARKTGQHQAELLGLGLLISDQAWTPVHVVIRVAPGVGGVAWVRCRVGDGGEGGHRMTRLPYGADETSVLLDSVREHASDIDWAYSVVREAPGRAV